MIDPFQPIIDSLHSDAWLLVRIALLYIVVPQIVIVIIMRGILKFRGGFLGAILTIVFLGSAFTFVNYGLPQIAGDAIHLMQPQ